MNVISKKFKDEKNGVIVESNLRLLLEVVCVFKFLEFIATWVQRVQKKKGIIKEKETQRSEHRQRHEEETKLLKKV